MFERAGFDDVMARDDVDMLLVGHRNMFAFSEHVEACAFEGSHERVVRDLRRLAYALTSTVLSFLDRLSSSMLSR